MRQIREKTNRYLRSQQNSIDHRIERYLHRYKNHKLNNENIEEDDKIHMFDTISFDIEFDEFQLENQTRDKKSIEEETKKNLFYEMCFRNHHFHQLVPDCIDLDR